MIKIQNKKGETVFVVKDDATKPERMTDEKWVLEDEEACPKCKQKGKNKKGEYPCPLCKRNLLHDEDLEEEK
jgi:hypothetical protein